MFAHVCCTFRRVFVEFRFMLGICLLLFCFLLSYLDALEAASKRQNYHVLKRKILCETLQKRRYFLASCSIMDI